MIGDNLKKIRVLKGISVKDSCGTKINKGNYWRIENNKVIPKVDTFVEILDNMNVSVRDYLELFDEKNNVVNEQISQLKFNFERGDISNIEKSILYCNDMYLNTGKIMYKHMSALSDIYVSRLKKENYKKKSVNAIKEYLFSCEGWTYYEIRILNNTIFLYDSDTIVLFYKRAIRFLDFEKLNLAYDNLKMKISENVIMHFVYLNENDKAFLVYKLLKNTTINEESAYAKIISQWIDSIIIYNFESREQGVLRIVEVLKIFWHLDMVNQFSLHKSWAKRIITDEEWKFVLNEV